jgi:mono/diheme cytochrome c family protein
MIQAGASAGRPVAVLGVFASPDDLLRAIREVRPKYEGRLEAYTPYPVHGMDHALGLGRSWLGAAVLAMGILGTVSALVLEWWTSAIDYPVPTGGKPLFSWQAFVPVMFELTVLFATFTAGLGMLFVANRLPLFGHPFLGSRTISATTRDKFALALEAKDESFDVGAAEKLLTEAGAESTEVLLERADEPPGMPYVVRASAAILLACAVAGTATYYGIKLYPTLPPMVNMLEQPRLDAFGANPRDPQGRGMRAPVPGTVARGHLPRGFATPEEAGLLLPNPVPRSLAVLGRGRTLYQTHCAVCHGIVGDGTPLLPSAYGAKPANLGGAAAGYPDGQIYGVIVLGKNAMPSYAADLEEDDRWAVVHYVRALERAQNAKDEDLK